MTIEQLSSISNTPNSIGAKASGQKTALTSDYEMFLQMLTTQMTNQDPLNPVDSSDYAVQLATFSSVEQQVLTNELLSELTTQLSSSGLTDLAGYVGKEVRTENPAYFNGTPIDIVPDIAPNADAANLRVIDARGRVVQQLQLDPTEKVTNWPGLDATGTPLPPQLYSFEVVSYAEGSVVQTEPASTYARIDEAQTTPSGLELILAGGVSVKPEDITAMRVPSVE